MRAGSPRGCWHYGKGRLRDLVRSVTRAVQPDALFWARQRVFLDHSDGHANGKAGGAGRQILLVASLNGTMGSHAPTRFGPRR